jgi:multidrug efflux pump subunit AcrB
LLGIIIRNSIILVDQIDQDIAVGMERQEAIIGSAVRRFRPIMLTALTAVLALIPISRGVFWGPLAYAMMGGILVATVLTIFVLPAGYALFFGREPKKHAADPVADVAPDAAEGAPIRAIAAE